MRFLASFFFFYLAMEWAAWAAHRYLMHGPLWWIHRDHHVRHGGFFELNDAFFLIFALPSWLGIFFGLKFHVESLTGMGFGVLAYGLTYVFVHELMIHRRRGWLPVAKRGYWGRVVRAHRAHHARAGKEDGRNFGLLWVRRPRTPP